MCLFFSRFLLSFLYYYNKQDDYTKGNCSNSERCWYWPNTLYSTLHPRDVYGRLFKETKALRLECTPMILNKPLQFMKEWITISISLKRGNSLIIVEGRERERDGTKKYQQQRNVMQIESPLDTIWENPLWTFAWASNSGYHSRLLLLETAPRPHRMSRRNCSNGFVTAYGNRHL